MLTIDSGRRAEGLLPVAPTNLAWKAQDRTGRNPERTPTGNRRRSGHPLNLRTGSDPCLPTGLARLRSPLLGSPLGRILFTLRGDDNPFPWGACLNESRKNLRPNSERALENVIWRYSAVLSGTRRFSAVRGGREWHRILKDARVHSTTSKGHALREPMVPWARGDRQENSWHTSRAGAGAWAGAGLPSDAYFLWGRKLGRTQRNRFC